MLQGHGDDGYKYKNQIIADFSTNVWYGGEPKGMKEYVFGKWNNVNRYPEVMAESLREKIAIHHHLSADQVLVNNGSTESIYLIAQLFAGKRTTILTPAFSEYEDACSIYDHQISFLSWAESLDLPQLRSDLVFICNPNNPTGQTIPDLEYWIKRNPACTFIVDEAFIDFTINTESAISLIDRFPNLIVMRSLTKAYAIPGLRLGYIVAHNDVINQLTNIKQPWTVNVMAGAAGEFIFDNHIHIQLPVNQLLADKKHFAEELQRNESIQVFDSNTHFFLCKTLVRNAGQIKEFLIEKHGLLIRDASNFRSLTRQHFRIATLHPDQNQLLVNALNEWEKLYY